LTWGQTTNQALLIPASAIDADTDKAMTLIESGVKDIRFGIRAYARNSKPQAIATSAGCRRQLASAPTRPAFKISANGKPGFLICTQTHPVLLSLPQSTKGPIHDLEKEPDHGALESGRMSHAKSATSAK
jgi:hypothetical protein